MKQYFIFISILFVFISSSYADVKLNDQTVVVFSTVENGKKILGQRDDFVASMSPFDRAARMKTNKKVSEKEYLSFVNSNVLPWDEGELAKLEATLKAISSKVSELSLNLPKTIYIIKTTGEEEGGAPYTRSNAIVLPKFELASTDLQKLLVHELFHILSRNDPKLRESLYNIIGFKPCNEIKFPATLGPRKITNPDAPNNNHYIKVTLNGEDVFAVPILFSYTPKYDIKSGGEFFKYLEFKLLIVKKNGDEKYETVYNGSEPVLVDVENVSGYFEKIGKNTNYIIHPEEILADNFELFVLNKQNVPSPQIIDNLKKVLINGKAI